MKDSVACNPDEFDMSKKYVRVCDVRADGFVEFDYCLGEPDMMLEMILPKADFNAFCEQQQVTFLAEDGHTADTNSPFDWRMHDATHNFSANNN